MVATSASVTPSLVLNRAPSMNVPACLNILSASAGMLGSFLLYRGTFGFESVTVWMSEEMAHETRTRNLARHRTQRAGVAFLFVAFPLQVVAQLWSLWMA